MSGGWTVKVYDTNGSTHVPASERVIFDTRACTVFYVIWIDDDHLEIQLAPWDNRCDPESALGEPPEGLKISLTRPSGSSKEALNSTLR